MLPKLQILIYMKIKHIDLCVDEKDPFINCQLDRVTYAQILTDTVSIYSDGFVLAINNEWGTGKTTFVKMWQQYLKNEGYNTLYFNAWENDFDANPLVAIMSELKTLTNSNDKIFNSVIQKGAILTKKILPTVLKAIAKNYIDTDSIVELIEKASESTTEILEDEIKNYSNKKKSVKDFKGELEKFIIKTNENKPLVFIIDELDRCRPNYAVEVLEQIKHFFSVKGIVFVLSIDKTQLGHAIKGVYGNNEINSDEYLRRFIDLEYSIPKPSTDKFCKYLYQYFSFDDFFLSNMRSKNSELSGDNSDFLRMAAMLFDENNLTLRQQEKIFGQTRLIISSFKENHYLFPHLFIFLIYLKTMKPDLYMKIETNSISTQELSNSFSDTFPIKKQDEYNVNLLYIEAMLLTFYNNQKDYDVKEKLYEVDSENKVTSMIKSKLERNSRSTLADSLQYVSSNFRYRNYKLKSLLSKINLTEPLVIN